MASNNARARAARDYVKAHPGTKYTEALRAVDNRRIAAQQFTRALTNSAEHPLRIHRDDPTSPWVITNLRTSDEISVAAAAELIQSHQDIVVVVPQVGELMDDDTAPELRPLIERAHRLGRTMHTRVLVYQDLTLHAQQAPDPLSFPLTPEAPQLRLDHHAAHLLLAHGNSPSKDTVLDRMRTHLEATPLPWDPTGRLRAKMVFLDLSDPGTDETAGARSALGSLSALRTELERRLGLLELLTAGSVEDLTPSMRTQHDLTPWLLVISGVDSQSPDHSELAQALLAFMQRAVRLRGDVDMHLVLALDASGEALEHLPAPLLDGLRVRVAAGELPPKALRILFGPDTNVNQPLAQLGAAGDVTWTQPHQQDRSPLAAPQWGKGAGSTGSVAAGGATISPILANRITP